MVTRTLISKRLELHSVYPELINDLFQKESEENLCNYFACDKIGLNHYREMYEKGLETHHLSAYFFRIIRREDGAVMGDCGFHTWNIKHHNAELFYFLKKEEYKRNGYLSEALPIALEFGFRELKMHRIQARIVHSNVASHKLLVKNNFVHEGHLREDYFNNGVHEDSELYSLLHHEFLK